MVDLSSSFSVNVYQGVNGAMAFQATSNSWHFLMYPLDWLKIFTGNHGFSPWKSIGFVSTGRQHGWWHVWWPIFERIWDVQLGKRATNGDFIKQIKLMRIVVSRGKTNGFFTKFNLYMFLRRKLTCPHDEAFDCYRLAHFWKETDGWMAAQDWPNQIWCYPPVSTNVAMGNPLWMDI